MRKLIDLPDNVIKILAEEAKQNARSVKAHLEYILIQKTKLIGKELIEICTKLIDANQRGSVIETIEWTEELEDYLKTDKK